MIDRRTFVLGIGAAAALPTRLQATEALAIPFQLLEAGPARIVVDVSIGGRGPYGFILDTGGATSLIDSKFAQSLKLETRGFSHLELARMPSFQSGAVARDVIVGNSFKLPEVTFAATPVIQFGRNLVGSLGMEFMTQHPGLISFDNRTWYLFHKSGLPKLEGYSSQPNAMVRSSHSPSAPFYATLLVNDTPVRLLVDTGSPTTMKLSPQALRRTGLDRHDLPMLVPTTGGTKGRMQAVRASKASFGGVDLGQPVVLRDRDQNPYYPDGVIGIRLLSMFNFAPDPATGTLWFKRNSLPPLAETLYADP